MRLSIIVSTIIIVLLLITENLTAEPIPINTGLPLLQQVPEISAVDTQGSKKTLKQLTGQKGLILVLFRSADWCPYCKKQLLEINQWNEKFNQLGYTIAAISYDSQQTLADFSDNNKLGFTLLADIQHQTMKSYQVLNQEYQPNSKKYGIPYPGVMVISDKNNLIFKYFYQGYKQRVNLQSLYDQLAQMGP